MLCCVIDALRLTLSAVMPVILPYYTNFQATNDGLTSQIKTLQIALAEAKEENCARIEHEAILVHQFQVGVLLIVVYYGNALTATIIYILSY